MDRKLPDALRRFCAWCPPTNSANRNVESTTATGVPTRNELSASAARSRRIRPKARPTSQQLSVVDAPLTAQYSNQFGKTVHRVPRNTCQAARQPIGTCQCFAPSSRTRTMTPLCRRVPGCRLWHDPVYVLVVFFCHPASEAIWGIFDPREISGRGTRRDHLRVLLQTGLATDQDFARIDDLFAAKP